MSKMGGMRVKVGDLDLSPGQPKGSETILSEEMWEKVLMNLTDPSDVLNASKTCVQFQRILHSKMIEAYLAKTLPFLINYMDDDDDDDDDDGECDDDEEEGRSEDDEEEEDKAGKTVLNCRLVSKGWRGVVDEFFENYFLKERSTAAIKPATRLEPFQVTLEHCALYLFGTNEYGNIDHAHFIREMRDHPGNPFIGRAVHFKFGGGQDLRTVYNFFEIFGAHIWSLELDISGQCTFPFIMRDVFVLAPNLKNLLVITLPPAVGMRKNEIRALPPPPRSLQKLQFLHSLSPDCTVERAILLRHSQSNPLRTLHIRSIDSLRTFNSRWPNLRELHFTNIERIGRLGPIFRELRLPKLELLSIALERFTVSKHKWRKSGDKKKRTFVNLFIALNELKSPNLKTLRFGTTWLWDKDSDGAAGFPIGLPCPQNIKTLEIPEETVYFDNDNLLFHGTSDYSFLLRFPFVENIRVVRDGLDDDENVASRWKRHRQGAPAFEILQLHQFMYDGRMYESNIWQLLPLLKEFSYGDRVYTRASYDRRQLRQQQKKSEGESRRHRDCGTQTVSTGDIIAIDYEGFVDD